MVPSLNFDLSDIVVLEKKVRVTNGVRPFNPEIAPLMHSLAEIANELTIFDR